MESNIPNNIPKHVAIIMDGNGRWAKARMMPRVEGHRQGAKALKRIVKASRELGIRYLTVYAFSTENWKRPEAEVSALMKLFISALNDDPILAGSVEARYSRIGRTPRKKRTNKKR